ncbi:MAG: GNAT family N-acetyltransferase [Anaerolineae bacterium]|nr:MAG: GNAT family N-acetyltransferase [Anaerolineae bacterium]
MGVSLAFNILLILLNYSIALSVGADVPLGYFFLFVPPTSLALMVPTVGGLGAREWAYTELWPQVGVSTAEAGAMSLLNYAVNAATGVIGGVLYAVDSLAAVVRRAPSPGHPAAPMKKLKRHTVILEGRAPHGRYIRLRPMTEDDWRVLVKWNSDPEVLYYAEEDDVTAYTLEQVQALYRSVCENAICFIVEADGKPIGEGWLQKMNLEWVLAKYPGLDCRRIDLAIGEKQYWGQGIGMEVIRLLTAFGFLEQKADVIYEPGIADYNVRSLQAFQKVGYEIASKRKTEPGSKANFLYDLVLTRRKFLESQSSLAGSEAKPG